MPSSPLKPRERDILRALFTLAHSWDEVTPTMVSDAIGLTCCARIVDATNDLIAKGLVTKSAKSTCRSIMALTPSGTKVAEALPRWVILSRRPQMPKTYGRKMNIDLRPIHEPEFMPRQLMTDEGIALLYGGLRYKNIREGLVYRHPAGRPFVQAQTSSSLENY